MPDDEIITYGAFDPGQRNNPYPLYTEIRSEGPVRRVHLMDGRPAWLITGYEEARVALADPRLSKDIDAARERWPDSVPPVQFGLLFSRHLLSVDPPDHTRLRNLVAKAFTISRVEALAPRIREITEGLLDGLEGERHVDLIEHFAYPLPITVICDLLGVPLEGQGPIREWFTSMLSLASTPGREQEAAGYGQKLAGYFGDLVAAKRAAPDDRMLSALIEACDGDDDTLDERELLAMTFLLFLAGHETTVNLIANGTVALLRNPDQRAALVADPDLIPGAVEEFLRYDGPLQHSTFRVATEPFELGGVTIGEGDVILVSVGAADRDPNRFADPDRLDVRRDTRGHLAFGFGIHFCLGAPLARLEGQIAFASLLRRYPAMQLACEPEALSWRPGVVLRGLSALPVELVPQPASVG